MLILISIFGNSNSVPNIWYHKILRAGNKPDDVGITILSDLLRLHLKSTLQAEEFQVSYAYFQSKFNYTCEQSYMALVRLKKGGFVSTKTKPGKNLNDLYVTINVEKLKALNDESDDIDNNNSTIDNNNTSTIKEISPNIDLYIAITRDIEVKKEDYISGTSFDKNEKPNQGNNPESKTVPSS